MGAVTITFDIIIAVIALVITIVGIVGLSYLTKFSFNATESDDGQYCVDMTNTEKNFTIISIFFIWISVITSFVGSIVLLKNKY